MTIAIHQPEHLPWLGFFHKVSMADILVILDNVQFVRRYFHNRNRIRIKEGSQWLIVPVVKTSRDSMKLNTVRIYTEEIKWRKKNMLSVYHNYVKAPFFELYWSSFCKIYDRSYELLVDMNMAFIHFFLHNLELKRELRLASSLNVTGKGSDLILNICKALQAKVYISGVSGPRYLDFDKFKKYGIKVMIQEFLHPIYPQVYSPFLPCMSTIDLLFNCGQQSKKILLGQDVPVLNYVFL